MPTPKPPYPAAFRQQIVELVRIGRKPSDLAREFGYNDSYRFKHSSTQTQSPNTKEAKTKKLSTT